MGFSWWLTLAFIVLKLIGYIDWSWWWVISPAVISILFLTLINAIIAFLETNEETKLKGILKRSRKYK